MTGKERQSFSVAELVEMSRRKVVIPFTTKQLLNVLEADEVDNDYFRHLSQPTAKTYQG